MQVLVPASHVPPAWVHAAFPAAAAIAALSVVMSTDAAPWLKLPSVSHAGAAGQLGQAGQRTDGLHTTSAAVAQSEALTADASA